MRRRLAAALGLSLALAACSGGPDQGTVDACYLTIGVAVPGRDGKLGSTNGWRIAATKAADDAKHEGVRTAGRQLVDALSADVVAGGFTEAEIDRYAKAVVAMEKACKESRAFEGTPSSKKDPFSTPT